MCDQSIEDKIRLIIEKKIDVEPDEIVPEANFVDDLGLDSLDLAELAMSTEETFLIEISDEEFEEVETLQDLINLVEGKTNPRAA